MASNYELRKALYKQIKSKDLTVKIAANKFFRLVKLDDDTFLLNIDIQTDKGNITIKGLTKNNVNSYNTTSDIELLVSDGNTVYVKNTSTSETTITSTSIELVKGILNESYFDMTTTASGSVPVFNSKTDKGAFNVVPGSSSRIKNTVSSFSDRLYVGGPSVLNSTLAVNGLATLHSLAITNNTTIGGTLGVTGATTLGNILNVAGNLSIGTNKFNVIADSGNTSVGGTLGVNGATTLGNTLGVDGNLSVNTNKFNVNALTGDTDIAGDLDVVGVLNVTGVTNLTTLNTIGVADLDSLEVEGDSLFKGNVDIDGTLNVDSSVTLADTLNVTGLITGNLDGNAATATTLETPITINETSFNGSENITTNTWGTPRNITIGTGPGATKSVNGSTTYSWNHADIGINNPLITITAGTGLSDGGNFTLNQSGSKTITLNHSNSVAAGSVNEGGDTRTLAFGGKFKIPSFNYDEQGHLTGKSNIELTIPTTLASTSSIGLMGLGDQEFKGNKTFSDNVVIGGDLTVQGDNFIANTTTLTTEDDVIELRSNGELPIMTPAGIVIKKYDGTNDGGIVIKKDGEVRVGKVVMDTNGAIQNDANLAQPVLTRAERSNLTNNKLLRWVSGTNSNRAETFSDGTNRQVLIGNQTWGTVNSNVQGVLSIGSEDFNIKDLQTGSEPTFSGIKVNTIKTINGTNDSAIVIGHKNGDNNSSITRILGRLEVEGDDLFITGTSKYEEIVARTITGADDWENDYLLIQGPNKQEGKVLIRSNESNDGIVEIGSNTNIMGTLTVTEAITGNLSGSATKLETARTINGTSFDGSENITTNTWGTSRNITLGDTAKAVNGSENLTWTRSELGIQNPTITITAGSGLKTGGNFTLNQTDPKTITLDHSNSVIAGNVGPTNNPFPGFGGTFNTPYISYDAQGHITTGTVNRTTTIPSTLATTSVIGLVGTGEQTFGGNKTFANNVIISGNLTVQGDNFIANTTTLTTEDDVIELRSSGTNSITTPAGIVVKKYDGTNDGGIVIKNDGEVRVGNVVMSAVGAIENGANLAQPVLTRNEKDNMTTGNVLVWDGTNKRAVTSNQAKIGGVTLVYDGTSESVRFTF